MYSNAIDSPDSTAPTDRGELVDIESLAQALTAERLKQQIKAVRELGEIGTLEADRALVAFLEDCGPINPVKDRAVNRVVACGSAYQVLYRATSEAAKSFIAKHPAGVVTELSDRGVDYDELQKLLVEQDYQAADKLTTEKMCAIAGEDAIKRKWAYFTEVSQFPEADILTIDMLWRAYSEDKFGWSKQRDIWLRLGQNWERLWPQIAWKSPEGAWTRYPTEFDWDLDSAPVGHLPLFNQLRGVRVMNAMLSHPVWSAQESS